jgi:hypothetical protein
LREAQGVVLVGLAFEMLELPGLAGRVGDQAAHAEFAAEIVDPAGQGAGEARTILTQEITLGPKLTAAEAQAIYEQGPEAVVFALLQMAKLLAEQRCKPEDSPSTPSGMKPVYQKETTPRRRKRPGAKNGHQGCRRAPPPVIHQRVVLRLHRLQEIRFA